MLFALQLLFSAVFGGLALYVLAVHWQMVAGLVVTAIIAACLAGPPPDPKSKSEPTSRFSGVV